MTEAEALETVAARAQTVSDPKVSDIELRDIVSRHLRYTTRANSTAYIVGQVVRLSSSNGRVYLCIEPGTTTTLETKVGWPTYSSAAKGQIFIDGTVVWRDDGTMAANNYDINGAVKEVWLLKASKAAQYFNASTPTANLQEQQIYEHCLRQAALYEGSWVV